MWWQIRPSARSTAHSAFIYGAARAVLLFVIAALFFNFFIPENAPQWVADSRSKPFLDELGAELLAILPDDPEGQIIDRIRGNDDEDETALCRAPDTRHIRIIVWASCLRPPVIQARHCCRTTLR
jgi:hypothetical protein